MSKSKPKIASTWEKQKELIERSWISDEPTSQQIAVIAQAGIKADGSKPDLSLLPAEYLIEAAKALTFGARKYNAHNFRKGILTSRLLAAAQRHLTLEINGVPTDNESGLSHLSHALASLAMYAFMKNNKPELDDRYQPSQKEIDAVNQLMYDLQSDQKNNSKQKAD